MKELSRLTNRLAKLNTELYKYDKNYIYITGDIFSATMLYKIETVIDNETLNELLKNNQDIIERFRTYLNFSKSEFKSALITLKKLKLFKTIKGNTWLGDAFTAETGTYKDFYIIDRQLLEILYFYVEQEIIDYKFKKRGK